MIADNSDKSWETLGRTDPYYGVLTSERFRSKNLDASARDEFFASGSQSMVDLLKNIEGKLGPIARGSALDFGCGVGRLVLPLAAELGFESATGVDISPSMLAEARKNADRAGLKNIEFVVSDDGLSRLQGTFDFIHSFIVLQHTPVNRGEVIIRNLVGHLAPGGVAAIQLLFSRNATPLRRLVNHLRVQLRYVQVVANLTQGRPWNEPLMQMNRYDINRLLELLQACGFQQVTLEFMQDGTNLGAYLLVRRPR